jgi:hypothetical protein
MIVVAPFRQDLAHSSIDNIILCVLNDHQRIPVAAVKLSRLSHYNRLKHFVQNSFNCPGNVSTVCDSMAPVATLKADMSDHQGSTSAPFRAIATST